MSLSKDALDTITATAIAASGAPLDTHVPAILIPDGYSLETIENLQEHPARFRGRFTTHLISAFVHYVQTHTLRNQSAGFIEADRMLSNVIFDLGNALNPGHGEHTATLELKHTAPYSAVITATDDGRVFNQRDLTEWMEDWAPHIITYADYGDIIPFNAATAAIRRMRIETKGTRGNEIGDFSAKRSAMEEIEAKSADILPQVIDFTCIPYEHLPSITIHLRISVLTGETAPLFRLRWVNQERQQEQIAGEFLSLLSGELGGTLPMTIGAFSK